MVQKINNPQTKRKSSLPILREVEITYSAPKLEAPVRITTSRQAYEILYPLFQKTGKMELKEMFYVLLLNRANYVLGYSCIGIGSNAGVLINIIELYQLVIKTNSTGIILCHNHPSNSLKASEPDILLTKKVKAGCQLFDFVLLDHIIITAQSGYTSLTDEGLF